MEHEIYVLFRKRVEGAAILVKVLSLTYKLQQTMLSLGSAGEETHGTLYITEKIKQLCTMYIYTRLTSANGRLHACILYLRGEELRRTVSLFECVE